LNEKLDAKLFQHPILSFERCRELSEIINTGGKEEADAAKKEFVSCNLKLVRQIALGYRKTFPEVEIEDLFQMGVIGLIRATEKWDPLREFMFSTYATWWIRQSITRNATDYGSEIRIPVHMRERLDKVQSYLENYYDFFGFDPEPLEAADALQITEKEYKQIRESDFSFVSVRKVLDSSSEFSVRATNPNFESKSICDSSILVEWDNFVEQLNNVLDTLTDREAGVISMRFGINCDAPMTLEEIGKIYGVTRERIRQIESKSMTKLRHPSRSLVLKDYLEGFDFEVHQVPGELHQNNFVLANEPQD
jgi:RNA polymerase primary sigma factor